LFEASAFRKASTKAAAAWFGEGGDWGCRALTETILKTTARIASDRIPRILDTVGADLGDCSDVTSTVSNVVEVHMFDDIVQPSIRVGKRSGFSWPLSVAIHLLMIAIFVVAPLLMPTVLPAPTAAMIAFVSGDVPLPADPPPPPRQSMTSTPPPDVQPNAAPVKAPSAIMPESPIDSASALVAPVGDISDGFRGIGENLAPQLAPPPSEPLPAVRVGGNVRPPAKIKDVRPVYPIVAQQARVEGLVIIEATIGPTGRVVATRLLRSVPLLDDAALEAVRQWEFTPTLLNGIPVPVLMTVTVNFTLQ
jgi:protein TonB